MTISRPSTARRPQSREHHGDIVTDYYEWLRDKDDPAVITHLEAENAYTDERTAHLAGLRQRLFDEIRSRTLETDLSVPARQGEWWYYGRTVEGSEYGLQCRAPLTTSEGLASWTPPELDPDRPVPGEQVLLDGNAEAAGHDFFSLGSFDVTLDGRLMLYATDTAGDERYTLFVRDLTTGETLPDVIEQTFAGASFSPCGRFVVYTTMDDAWRPDSVWVHELGTSVGTDTRIFHEPDERFWVGATFTRSEKYLVIETRSSITSEEWLVEAVDPRSEPKVVWPRREGVEYGCTHAVIHGEDSLYILHNENALDFALDRAPVSDPGQRTTVLPPHSWQAAPRSLGVPRLGSGGMPPRGADEGRDARPRSNRRAGDRIRRSALHGWGRRERGVGPAGDPAGLRILRHSRHGL